MGQNGSKRSVNNNTPRGGVKRVVNPQPSPLAKNCVPLGLYPSCAWDLGLLKKAIIEKKLAPIFKGTDKVSTELEECPICFLYYPGGLNRSKCCKQPLCTECFLQVKKLPTVSVCCPFCNTEHYGVIFRGPKTKEEREIEEREQQLVLEAEERMRREERERDEERERKRKEERELLKEQTKDEVEVESEVVVEVSQNISDNDRNYDDVDEFVKKLADQLENHSLDPSQYNEDIEALLLEEAIKLSLKDS